MFHAILSESAGELAAQIVAAMLLVVPILWALLRERPHTMNRQIDALARKTRARQAP
jgi:hypothetical protein